MTAAVFGCATILALPACTHAGTGSTNNGSHSAPNVTAGALLVSLDDVRRITDVSTLVSAPGPSPHREPSHFDSPLPPPCHAIFDQLTAFGRDWQQFASTTAAATVSHSAGQANSMADIGQAVAVYPDDATVGHRFSALTTMLGTCRTLNVPNHDYTLDDSDPSTLVLVGHGFSVVYRLRSTVLLQVVALGLDHDEPAARALAQTISDRIH
jgi:hypothetical protein